MRRSRTAVGSDQLRMELPPGYSIRESSRARTVKLHMTPEEGLVIVVPAGYRRSRLPEIIAGKKQWIEKAQRWADEQRRLRPRALLCLPDMIDLQALGERWQVDYRHEPQQRLSAREQSDYGLLVSGGNGEYEATALALTRWTARKARRHLVPWLQHLSQELEMPVSGTVIRNQRTRWASCSPEASISLNQKLLLLPPRLVRYVLVHELCHTVHLNHSKRFWALVRKHEPESAALRRELGGAWQYVPRWLER